ncbi:DUF1656 domain-containing protein [Acuticoccus yangtzensis]|uniref:DUF1656 domain-containing protein n=1 Tax=Acuticoccus yangtzensis TaxID=1443441 RepID=UPI0009F803C0|nr:DUF1656 domain-containing protein [Acuticoccus yangtzensis]ORE96074.1 hypothetical protein ATO13_04410 [Stappia sp. 22II-S9-Z10]
MHHEFSVLGLFAPSLLLCAVAAAVLWFIVDGLMLRFGIWRIFLHPPLARLSLYIIILALTGAVAPDF